MTSSAIESVGGVRAIKEVNGVFTNSDAVTGTLQVEDVDKDRDYIYFGNTAACDGFNFIITFANEADTIAKCEYWNGSAWVYLAHEITNPTGGGYFLTYAGLNTVSFARPQDWAASEVNSISKFWIRFVVQGNSIARGAGATSIDVVDGTCGPLAASNIRGLLAAQFPSSKRYYSVVVTSDPVLRVMTRDTLSGRDTTTTGANLFAYTSGRGLQEDEPATIAVVPQFEEAYAAYNHKVFRFRNIPATGDTSTTVLAEVEDRDFAIGPVALFDKRFIAMLKEWPPCKYMSFFGGRLWAAGIMDEPYTIRWSAAAPYHRVWTSLAFEFLMEDDNSPITGLAPLGEHMVVFKQDSIWIMIPVGENPATGVQSFVPKRVVAGVGCVSNNSIKQIRGELVFLSENGIYAFNGTPAIRKVTERRGDGPDRLSTTLASISSPKRNLSAACHWRTKEAYLLSFSTAGGANNTTVVWEYHKDRWWIWDNIEAQFWLEDEGVGDDERIYFGDASGHIYEMGVGNTDHGATINGHVKGHRFGYFGEQNRDLRAVRLITASDTRSLSVEVFGDDRSDGTATVSTTDLTENDWTDFSYALGVATDDNWVSVKRRRKRADVQSQGEWHQVKISFSTKYQPMYLSRASLGFMPKGVR